jgi:hypothetical protein
MEISVGETRERVCISLFDQVFHFQCAHCRLSLSAGLTLCAINNSSPARLIAGAETFNGHRQRRLLDECEPLQLERRRQLTPLRISRYAAN